MNEERRGRARRSRYFIVQRRIREQRDGTDVIVDARGGEVGARVSRLSTSSLAQTVAIHDLDNRIERIIWPPPAGLGFNVNCCSRYGNQLVEIVVTRNRCSMWWIDRRQDRCRALPVH